MTDDEIAALVDTLRRCAHKLKAEYDRQQPDAAVDECWAEAEAAFDLLAAFDAANECRLDEPHLPTGGLRP